LLSTYDLGTKAYVRKPMRHRDFVEVIKKAARLWVVNQALGDLGWRR
jgi:hypothetical protein